ncbi:glycerophosphoryl diester phosphodiesterase membrane domain-containing protein [Evansella cellulosilytica]|nr:glycerophosphoryl diester phosphodiesterase membrane domain-containing protein [Evansella cellulosilytica]
MLRSSIHDFSISYKKYLSFAFIYMLLTSFLFVPLISYIFNRMIKLMGTGSLLNAEVYKIGSSFPGLMGMLLISFLVSLILFLEFGVMILIAQQGYFRKRIYVSQALITTMRKFPKILGFGLFQIILITLLFIPFIELSVFPALLDFNIAIFLTSQLYGSSDLAIFIYLLIVILAIYLFIRFLFTLHYIFIEECSVWKSMQLSWKLTKKNNLKTIFYLILLNVLIFIVGFLFITMISYIPSLVETVAVGTFIQNYLVTFSSFMAIIFSLLLVPINVIIVTRLFYRYRKRNGEDIEDALNIYGSKSLITVEKRVKRFFSKRFTISAAVFIYVTSMFFINFTINDNLVYLNWNVQVAAHRGDLHSAPENSLSSIRSAIDKGVDAVEIDVMLTKDGEIILNHDYTFQRVAGVPDRVIEMTYEEVAEVDIGRLFSDEFIGEPVPTLEEAIIEVMDENVTFIIDVKIDSTGEDRRDELAKGIVDLVEQYDMVDVTYVQSFDYDVLQEVRQRNSDIKIGQILYLSAGNLSSLDVDFYTIRQTMLSERFIENARRLDREVWVWTVNLERNMREVLKYDIDGIITDYPERAQRVIGIDFAGEEELPMEGS